MTEFVGALPESKQVGRKPDKVLADFAAELRARPGEWARWPKVLTENTLRVLPTQINKGRYVSFPAGEFEAATRDGIVYVRYTGGIA